MTTAAQGFARLAFARLARPLACLDSFNNRSFLALLRYLDWYELPVSGVPTNFFNSHDFTSLPNATCNA
jgi:hypothetical protein